MTLATPISPVPNIVVEETIGRGGFSVVHRAFDTKLNRQVAVKVMTGGVDPADQQRFEQECRIHGPLSSHPNIVTVFDAGVTTDGSPYLVMELVQGGSLTDQVNSRGRIEASQAVEWMIPVARAVQAAHDKGILHRDVKPSNILLAPEGPKLADFGIACGSAATSPEFAVSWLHAAPEAHENQRDERSDVYSLGSTLYELLAGKPPYYMENQPVTALLMRLLNEPVPALPAGVASPQLADIIARCLAKDPSQRPQTAAALADELAAVGLSGARSVNPGQGAFARPTVAVPSPVGMLANTGGPEVGLVDYSTVSQLPSAAASRSATLSTSTDASTPKRRRWLVAALILAAVLALGGGALAAELAKDAGQSDREPTASDPAADGSGPDGPAADGSNADGSAADQGDPDASPDGDPSGDTDPDADADSDLTGGPDTGEANGGHPFPAGDGQQGGDAPGQGTDPQPGNGGAEHPGEGDTNQPDEPTTDQPDPDGHEPVDPEPAATSDTLPDVEGLTEGSAQSTLADAGFTHVSSKLVSSPTAPKGTVISTNPGAGTVTEFDAQITLSVSSGPAKTVVPGVVGLPRDDATADLEDAKLVVSITYKIVNTDQPSGVVLSQGIVPGVVVSAGTTIELVVSRHSLVIVTPELVAEPVTKVNPDLGTLPSDLTSKP